MAFISRLSNWLARTFDMSESEDPIDDEAASGFLMTGTSEASNVLPQLRTRAEAEPIAEPPTFRPPAQRPAPQADQGASTTGPAPVLQVDDGELLSEITVPDETVTAEVESVSALPGSDAQALADDVQQPQLAEQAESEPPSSAADPAGVSQETTVAPAGTDDVLSMFRTTTTATEFKDLTNAMEDVPREQLLADAREVRDLLIGAASNTDHAA